MVKANRGSGSVDGQSPEGFAAQLDQQLDRSHWGLKEDRRQVELFFKALKQTAKITTFVGTSANAVRTQVWTALIAMPVLKYLQLKSSFSWSLATLAALLRQQLFFYRDLWAWLDDPFQAPPALAGVHDDAQQLEMTW
jgi:hypothetical protein